LPPIEIYVSRRRLSDASPIACIVLISLGILSFSARQNDNIPRLNSVLLLFSGAEGGRDVTLAVMAARKTPPDLSGGRFRQDEGLRPGLTPAQLRTGRFRPFQLEQ
jgi:hypothetical protein